MRKFHAGVIATFMAVLIGLHGHAFASQSTPTSDFVDNGDGTTTHLKTGLMWMRCAMGQTWSGSTCSGTAQRLNSVASTSYAGYSDWRVPTISELNSIAERAANNPSINSTVFPNTPADMFLSATPYVQLSNNIWVLNFYSNADGTASGSGSYYARLVRGGQAVSSGTQTTPTADFVDNKDGTVTHSKTGLMWMRCVAGKSWSGTTCTGTTQYLNWTNASALTSSFAGHTDWRLPTVDELKSIVEYTTYNPAINTAIFPSVPTLWTSIPVSNIANYAYYINTAYGVTNYQPTSSATNGALLVRGVQPMAISPPPPVKVVSLALSCPSSLTYGSTGNCAANAGFSDFSKSTVTPIWAASNPSALTVNSDGSLIPGNIATDTPVTVTATYSQGGNTKTATSTVTVKGNSFSLTSLAVTCPTTVASGTTGACTANASYSNGSSKAVQPMWSSSNAALLSVDTTGTLSAGVVSANTAVTITASYSEGSVTKSATSSITVKPASALLSSISISGDSSVTSEASITLKATATYSNGTTSAVTPTWSVSDLNIASISANGLLTAKSVSTDTPITVSASYIEGGVTKTATWMVTIKAAAALTITPTSQQQAPGATYTLTAKNGILQSCLSSNTAVSANPVVASDGLYATGTVLLSAVANSQTILTCTGLNSSLTAKATLTVTTTSDSDRIFNWAEHAYPEFFAPAGQPTKSVSGYTYRYYPQQNSYLATMAGHLYYLGPLTQNQVADLGSTGSYLQQAITAGY